jgi:hypothetical protein
MPAKYGARSTDTLECRSGNHAAHRLPGSVQPHGEADNADAAPARKSWPPFFIVVALAGLFTSAPEARAADPVARNVAAAAGLTYSGTTQGESPVFDYDKDGDPDILLSTHGTRSWPLMRNNGNGTFTEVLAGTFFTQDRHGCVAGDFGSTGGTGKDGLLDVYCVVGACQGNCTKEYPNELWLQKPDRTFVNVGRTWGVADVHGRGREPVTLDHNKDGRLDLAVANEGPSIYPALNRLFRNAGGGFQEVTGSAVRAAKHSECVEAADTNGDGWPELFFCSTISSSNRVITYKNNSGTFQDITSTTPYRGVPAREIELKDVNKDGKPDLLIVQQTRLTIRLNASGGFPNVNYSYTLSEGRDTAVGDVNLDGWPDIYIVQGKNSQYGDVMLINNGNGVSYRTMPIPQVSTGDGDVATTIPNWLGTGRAAFLVTNGKWGSPGPTELITFAAQ